ncbi:MAG: M20/M25/M40 family metallo-hydrolase [Candidatus Riflebacteria bacterium]|nr:M20/M25/M40 family metallo-hydrolase [Candidatus Riflebacteria bacterium]
MHPVILLQRLIQFDTTNPPGNEVECLRFIQNLLSTAGVDGQVFAKIPDRPNLIARIRGQGHSPPLLMYGHIDVVTTTLQPWSIPPFEGRIHDGFVWGRGALDMKGGIAMMISAFICAATEREKPHGDIILLLVCDEEAGGEFGAKFLTEQHPDLFTGVRYAIGEFGGFTTTIGRHRFYHIQVAEKQACRIRATLRGPGGHGSIPVQNGAMAQLGNFLQRLENIALPVHITPVVRRMFKTMASTVGGLKGMMLTQLLNPYLADGILRLLGDRGRDCLPLIHNTAIPTILRGGNKINVIPSEVSVELDGRVLPGYGADDLLQELTRLGRKEVEFEIMRFDPGPANPDLGLFHTLADILHRHDPSGTPVPMLLSGTTDARFFSRLAIQTYGFLPMPFPEDFAFSRLLHSADERIPVSAMEFGVGAITTLLQHHW